MKTKAILSLALVGALASSVFATDYSKTSNEELIKMSGKVAPKDYPDYRMEIHKRMQNMKVKDAGEFGDKLREAHWSVCGNMTQKEHQEYHDAIHQEMQKRLNSMSEAKARESGLIGYGYYGYGYCGYGHHRGGEYGRGAGRGGHRDCYNPKGYRHSW